MKIMTRGMAKRMLRWVTVRTVSPTITFITTAMVMKVDTLMMMVMMMMSVCVRLGVMGSAETHSEDDQGSEMDLDLDRPNWQQQVSREVLASLTPHQIKRQEVINGTNHLHCPHTDTHKSGLWFFAVDFATTSTPSCPL